MKKINELFYSLQGEGMHSGTAAVFVRFSGCNLHCPFCDTDHEEGLWMTNEEIVNRVQAYPARMVVLTGGEPSLYVDPELIEQLHRIGKFITIETNGTHLLPEGIDWITLSPKFDCNKFADVVLTRCDELKVVYQGQPMDAYNRILSDHYFLQPCDTGNKEQNLLNMKSVVDYCLANPRWRLSLQIHKIINII
ncbi:MAG: 7-carboxy-7-deazaguanine synthase QueE [Bacteroidaceae bacterium]